MYFNSDRSELEKDIEKSMSWIAQSGLRPTKQRIKLAQLLIGDGKNKHITAESLFELVKKGDVSVSLATVYNTLKAFCRAGLINEVVVDGGRSYFDTRLDEHSHFFWEDTGEISDAPGKPLEIGNIPKIPHGSKISKVDVIIRLRKST